MLPNIKSSSEVAFSGAKRLLIIAEGFETRSLAWIGKQKHEKIFDSSIVFKYHPEKKSRFEEMSTEVGLRTKSNLLTIEYNSYEPTVFEQAFEKQLENINDYDEIYIDITVMSKMLILIVVNKLKIYKNTLHIIYTEPESWGPTKEQFEKAFLERKLGASICLSSIGVGDTVRTPGLSSIVMQNSPPILIAFLSFNEQLVNMLINEINPEKIILINQKCLKNQWRVGAIQQIHETIIDEYRVVDGEDLLKYELKDYHKVFEKIADVYKKSWLTNRLIISPTGFKLHAFACALAKICCPDIHIEYPTPESYLFDGYSSDNICEIHELTFLNFQNDVINLANEYGLNG